jgi:phenylpyruvate tautomerase PptA (4-oxalocrotonate tautomerase family)
MAIGKISFTMFGYFHYSTANGKQNHMPISKIEVLRSRPAAEIQAMMQALYEAQREALKVPEDDRTIRYVEHKREHFPIPPGKTENYTIIEINIFPGRSLEAKRNLYKGIFQRFEKLGIKTTDIIVILNEPPLENYGIRGLPASEVDLGFRLDV